MGGARLLTPGQHLGPFRVEVFLARGASGEVYRAADEKLGRNVALKVLPPWMSEEPRTRDRFLAEARAAAALDHPNILPVYDAGDADGTLWIAMRLADGPDLRELLRRGGPLSPERAVSILSGIAAALDAAHARGILHRDVKPANILLGADPGSDHAYLADFGLATAAHGRGLTRTGELLGTVDYVSPEQARGEHLDARSDAWSLAAVLFECLAGVPPFHRESELAALTARIEAPAPSPSSLRPDLPAALDPVLARGLALVPAERYPSAGALLAAARAAIGGARMRGLLFADLRDYTGFAEREGDARAAALLARYRDLVRPAFARTGGAEIRTEGDSFYVVFPSATSAIRAGLAIAAAAAAATEEDPSLPVRPGIGVHAGEPLDAPEGPVGASVNAAARLCGLAAPGEVLVSTTARALAAGSHDLAFSPRGAHQVKGLAEPLEAWAASLAAPPVAPATEAATVQPAPLPTAGSIPVSTASRPLRGRRTAIAGVAAGTVAVLLIVAGLAALTGPPSALPSPSAGAARGTPGSASVSPAAAAAIPGQPSPSAPSAAPISGVFPNVAEQAILDLLPATLAPTCRRGGTPDDARLAGFVGRWLNTAFDPFVSVPVTPRSRGGVTCHPASGAVRLYVMAPYGQSSRAEGAPADEFVGYLSGRHTIPDGSCATEDRATERWTGPQGSGRLACMNTYEGRPWIYFTFNGGKYLAFATRDDAKYDALYAWWDQLKTFLP